MLVDPVKALGVETHVGRVNFNAEISHCPVPAFPFWSLQAEHP
jgi:hypothetical protein